MVPYGGFLSRFPVLCNSVPGFLCWHHLRFQFSTNLSRTWQSTDKPHQSGCYFGLETKLPPAAGAGEREWAKSPRLCTIPFCRSTCTSCCFHALRAPSASHSHGASRHRDANNSAFGCGSYKILQRQIQSVPGSPWLHPLMLVELHLPGRGG